MEKYAAFSGKYSEEEPTSGKLDGAGAARIRRFERRGFPRDGTRFRTSDMGRHMRWHIGA